MMSSGFGIRDSGFARRGSGVASRASGVARGASGGASRGSGVARGASGGASRDSGSGPRDLGFGVGVSRIAGSSAGGVSSKGSEGCAPVSSRAFLVAAIHHEPALTKAVGQHDFHFDGLGPRHRVEVGVE